MFIVLPKITAITQMIKTIIAIPMSESDHTTVEKSYLLYVSFT